MPLRIRRIAPLSVRPAKVPCFLRADTDLDRACRGRSRGHPGLPDRRDAILLPAVDPGQEMAGEVLEQVDAGDLAALVDERGARRSSPGSPSSRPPRGDAEADHQPVRHLGRRLGARARHAHAADHAAVDLDPVRPAEGHRDHRRQRGCRAHRQGRASPPARSAATPRATARAPGRRRTRSAPGRCSRAACRPRRPRRRRCSAALERIDLGRDRQRSEDRRETGRSLMTSTSAPALPRTPALDRPAEAPPPCCCTVRCGANLPVRAERSGKDIRQVRGASRGADRRVAGAAGSGAGAGRSTTARDGDRGRSCAGSPWRRRSAPGSAARPRSRSSRSA